MYREKFQITEEYSIIRWATGYFDKDGCIPGIENGTWVQVGPDQYIVHKESRQDTLGSFNTLEKAKQYIKERLTND